MSVTFWREKPNHNKLIAYCLKQFDRIINHSNDYSLDNLYIVYKWMNMSFKLKYMINIYNILLSIIESYVTKCISMAPTHVWIPCGNVTAVYIVM